MFQLPTRSIFAAVVAVALPTHAARAQAKAPPTPACGLLTVAQVRTIAGSPTYPDFVDGDAEGEGAGGGSSCQYGGESMAPGGSPPLISVVLIKGKDWTRRTRAFKLAAGCRRDTVAGVGDDAFFQVCPATQVKRSPPLYVKAGTADLIVQMDVQPPATRESVQQVVIALARAAAAKAR
jgi:hypothetical protein